MSDTTTIRGDEKGYNGWTNYETWSVSLFINNERGSQSYWEEVAEECYRESEKDETFSRFERARLTLLERLKDWHEEFNPLAEQISIFSQLLSAAISDVNWFEIADNMPSDLQNEGKLAEIDAEDAEPELVTLRDFVNANPDKKIVIFYISLGAPTGSFILPDNEAWTTVSEWELWDLEGEVEHGEWNWNGEGSPKDAQNNSIRVLSAEEDNETFDELMDENYGN